MSDEWVKAKDVLDVINGEWTWMRNSKCKYIELYIDTRDGHCLLSDRKGNRITLDELKYQHGAEDE